METNQNSLENFGKLLLRVSLGLLVLLHGIAKLRTGVGPIGEMLTGHGLPAFLAYGSLAGEVLGPLLVLSGFYARIGAVIIVVNMLFAFGLAHMAQLFQLTEDGGWAVELQGMYLAVAGAIALLGPGRYAINQR